MTDLGPSSYWIAHLIGIGLILAMMWYALSHWSPPDDE